MAMMEPRVVHDKQPSESLVYHIDMAQKASYDLRLVTVFYSTVGVDDIYKLQIIPTRLLALGLLIKVIERNNVLNDKSFVTKFLDKSCH
jgi:hypothetical protein